MEWFERWFGEEYLTVYEHRNTEEAEREIQAITKLLDIQGNELILNLCCGAGRHDFHLVNSGCRVIGLDYSIHMLKLAIEKRHFNCDYPDYVRADARKIPFRDGSFDIILNLFTSFGYFEDSENRELIHSISRLLKPCGKFLIDYINPSKTIANLVEESTKEKEGLLIIEKRDYNQTARRVEKTITLQRDKHSQVFHESVQLYESNEMIKMLSDAGLKTKNILGSVEGEPYSESSERMIIYGSKEKYDI
ncbi:class I SAM-dependent methyltransferase [Candidatus Latescibacterota bacterium]